MDHLSVVKHINPNITDLRGLIHELVINKRTILSLIIISVILTFIYNSLTIPKYRADVLIRIQDSESANASSFAFPRAMLSDNKNEARYSALLRSRYILTPVIHQLGLNIGVRPDKPLILASLFPSEHSIQIAKFIVPSNVENKPFKLMMDAPQHFKLFDENKLVLQGAINQSVQSTDGTIVLEIKQWQTEVGSRLIITKFADEEIIEALGKYLSINDLGTMDGNPEKTGILQVSYIDENPTQLVNILNATVNILQEKNITQKSAKAKETLLLLQKQLPLAKKALEDAETSYNNYRAQSKKWDPKVELKILLNQIAEIDKQLTKLRLHRRTLLRENTEAHPFIRNLDDKAQSLLLERKALEDKLAVLPASDQIAVRLKRDIKSNQHLYLILLKKIQALKIEQASIMSDIQILSHAQLPHSPLPQYPWLVTLLGGLFGFIVGCMIVFIRKTLFPKVNDPYWGEQHLELPTLAIIPYSQREKNFQCKKILAREHNKDFTLEVFRGLRTRLQALLFNASSNIISIIGLTPQIGKSFIAVNLAYLLAESGKRVLLIDGDLRGGHLQTYFELSREPGFSDVINNNYTVEEALHATSHPNLTLLPTGTHSIQPSELLMKPHCEKIIKALALQYDIVMIDTTPVLAVTDAAIISRYTSTNLLVLGADIHHSNEIKIAVKLLSYANVKLHGVIFNNLKRDLRNLNMHHSS